MKKTLLLLAFAALTSIPASAGTQAPIRIKCGGSAVTDSQGKVWAADYGFNGGHLSLTPDGAVGGTLDPKLFQGGRWGDDPLTYTFPVANGAYRVNLYFIESYPADQSVGARIFDVKMQGTTVFPKLDIYAVVGANTALIKGADINVTNGAVTIRFDSIMDHAKVTAIEITEAAPPALLTLNFTYPGGAPVLGTLTYTMSNSLINLGGAVPLIEGQATCMIVSSPSVLGLVGQFQVNLSLADPAGRVLWQINTAINPSNLNFGGVQSSALNVVIQN
ncbi:MAG TPA: malectin domain-containing carbohydrate-binding protein [Candidatus Saccharimonadales bacterium]|nr:malectin domain-containing carbohydrate-binding protein [Candidatus Saccharimonadales bacterium]